MKNLSVSSLAVLALAAAAVAQPVVPTPLTAGPQVGVGVGFLDPLSTAAWYTFTLTSPTNVIIDIDRITGAMDPWATLYAGDITGLDATALGTNHDIVGYNNFGPLTWVDTQDDTTPPAVPGPWGDPQFNLALPAGTYSLVVTGLQGTPGNFTITSNVPTPASAALLGVAGVGAMKRRRR